MARRKIHDVSVEEAAAEAVALKPALEKADRVASRLWLHQWLESELESLGALSTSEGEELVGFEEEDGELVAVVRRNVPAVHEDLAGKVGAAIRDVGRAIAASAAAVIRLSAWVPPQALRAPAHVGAGGHTATKTFPVNGGKIRFTMRWTISKITLTWDADGVPQQHRVFINFVDAASREPLTSRLSVGRISVGKWERTWQEIGIERASDSGDRAPPTGWGVEIELAASE